MSEDKEQAKRNALTLFVTVRLESGLTHREVAEHFHVSRRTIIAWETGESTPDEKATTPSEETKEETTRRELMIRCLWDLYNLKADEQRFYNIWRDLVVGVWNWAELSELEKVRYDLEFHPRHWIGVPARPLRISLYGREELMARVKSCVEPGTALVLTGLPGSGKTRFVIELARDREIMERFPDGIIWLRMGQQPNIVAEVTRIGEDMGVEVAQLPPETRWRAVQNAIGTRYYLFIIDDVWATDEVRKYFFANFDHPNCCTVTTTRNEVVARSLVATDQIIRVPELETEGEQNPAYDLLHKLAQDACNTDPQVAQQLVERVGGLPLALVLLGGFLSNPERTRLTEDRKRAFEELNDPMKRLQLAQQRLGAIEDREMTLQEIISLSISTLPDYMIPAFYALGVFAPKPESFSMEAALEATNADRTTLITLTLRNLLEIDVQERLTIHTVLCDVARTATSDYAFVRIAEYYTQLAETQNKQGVKGLQRLDVERAHIVAVINGCVTHEHWETVCSLVRMVHRYLFSRGYWADRVNVLSAALRASRTLKRRYEELPVLGTLGVTYHALGDMNRALEYLELALKIAGELRDKHNEGVILSNLGDTYLGLGKLKLALDHYLQALEISRKIVQHEPFPTTLSNLASTLFSLGEIYFQADELDKSFEYLEQALDVACQAEDLDVQGAVLCVLGQASQQLQQPDTAMDYYKQSLALARKTGNLRDEGIRLGCIANLYYDLEQIDTAIEYHKQALDIAQRINDRYSQLSWLQRLGDDYCVHGKKELALEYYKQAMSLCHELDNLHGQNHILSIVKKLDAMFLDESLIFTDSTVTYAKQFLFLTDNMSEYGDIQAPLLRILGQAHLETGDQKQAIAHLYQAGEIFLALKKYQASERCWRYIGRAFKKLGYLQQAMEAYEYALRLFTDDYLLCEELESLYIELNEIDRLQALYRIYN